MLESSNFVTSRRDRVEIKQFREWLESLSRVELLQAMRISFQPDAAGIGGSCHEYELLKEMVRLESPPPTPVHPRAMGYRQRMSQRGAQLDYPKGEEMLLTTQPRMFQWNESHSSLPGKTNKKERRFDVVARRKVASWGEVYSVGCTQEQQEADMILVDSTFVTPADEGEKAQLIFRNNFSTTQVLRLLEVSSRGLFFRSKGKSTMSFCSPWLQPTERWFSLSFYLASRYHVALWESFKGQGEPLTVAATEYDDQFLCRATIAAFRLGIRQAMEKDLQNIRALRDSLSWGFLFDNMIYLTFSMDEISDWDGVMKSVQYTRLRDLGSPRAEISGFISNQLKKILAKESERILIQDAQNLQPALLPKSISTGKRKKNSKRKRRVPKRRAVPPSILEDNESEGSNEMGEGLLTENRLQNNLSFPDNGTPPMERNRNIILALAMVDEVIEAAFLEVGLEPTPPFAPVEVKEDKKSSTLKRKSTVNTVGDSSIGSNASKPVRDAINNIDSNGASEFDPRKLHNDGGHLAGERTIDQTSNIAFAPLPLYPSGATAGPVWPTFPSAENGFQYLPPPQETINNFYQPTNPNDVFRNALRMDEGFNEWPFLNGYHMREQSILSEFFQDEQDSNDDDDEKLMVASTAASVSSSTYNKDPVVLDDSQKGVNISPLDPPLTIDTIDEDSKKIAGRDPVVDVVPVFATSPVQQPAESCTNIHTSQTDDDDYMLAAIDSLSGSERATPEAELPRNLAHLPRSPSPQAPLTPPPTLSPILLSLADLRDFKRGLSLTPEKKIRENMETRSYSAVAASGSLPGSPTPKGMSTSWSREDLRIKGIQDDQMIKPKRRVPQTQKAYSDLQPSYRAAAVKSLAKPIASSKASSLDFRSQVLAAVRREAPRESCARSETAVEKHRDDPQWSGDFRRMDDFDNRSATRDETTTITSALSQNREPEEIAILREERNAYRDMCLTLGAEVAKLKAMLAAEQANAIVAPFEYHDPFGNPIYQAASFDPHGMQPFFYGINRGQRLGPMSDAGIPRGGDYESQVSEDENFESISRPRIDNPRQGTGGATVVGSDVSVDFNNSNSVLQSPGPKSSMPVQESQPVHGLQSRLAKDLMRFVDATRAQLLKQDSKRRTAVERFTRLVNTIWPRAQVKIYGSHVSGLCLPSSDLDFVVCLPAVHKNAPALAPGVLEGRNAINESSQKLLARELKGESWIDPRSIKLIERTVVPVIKVSTKDTRAKVVQLDISFDSPEHHGLEANAMVALILDELPLIRPLMLILKQFLLNRGLLTAYTGGLSSYCLFLMVARYLQEQPQSVNDCGSLLMGFLDFYGNYFDPRATGISVRSRQYFNRAHNYHPGNYPVSGQALIWPPQMPPAAAHNGTISPVTAGPHDYLRRNSFSSETASVDGGRHSQRPPRFQGGPPNRFKPHKAPKHSTNKASTHNQDNNIMHGRPFTFDPIFVEDPLSLGNNVGRNAFRIFQVQRAFSDAHRALVASLEWDIHSAGDINDGMEAYPLLKCLLQSEDIFYEL